MGVSDELRGRKIGPISPPFDIWFQDLAAFCLRSRQDVACLLFLDKRGADGVVGGCDVYEEGLAGVRLVEDRW